MPPMLPVPPMKMMGIHRSGRVIDLNDPNIISYKKKDMSGDREKIEIIRKKSSNNKSEAFNFRFEDGGPMAPEAPEFNWKSDRDSLGMKIIEKGNETKRKRN